MSSFDFADYLQRRTSPDGITSLVFSVEILTGGLTNHTARITFSEPIASIGKRALERGGNPYSLKSVVLKHAPPFMAIDPSRPMSVDRQLVEKRAFQILAGEDAEFPEAKNIGHGDAAKVHIPKLIWHDEETNVLWIEDLGNLKTLSEIILSEEDTGLEANIERVGAELGAFLFEFFSMTSDPPTSFIAYMAKVSDRSGIYDYLADVVLKNLGDAGVEDAKLLSERVRNFFDESDTADLSKCLGMVDFWPENVLVDLGEIGNTDSTKCGLVDWEYFGVSDAPSELGMFLAHLHVHMLNSTTSVIVKHRIKRFTDVWLRAYVGARVESENEAYWKPSNGFIRRLLLSHGRDLVRGVKLYGGKIDGATKHRLLEGGARSLRAAGGSRDDVDLSVLKQERDEVHLKDIWEGYRY
ncbi:kinase-like domain-containing protein [Pholiota molesta]|nr:kinase-like domain-containing protein [Pholiota molesta]